MLPDSDKFKMPQKLISKDDQHCTSLAPLLEDAEDNISLENNTNLGRRKEKARAHLQPSEMDRLTYLQSSKQTISFKNLGGEQEKIKAFDFYEQSNYLIDTLKDDLCSKKKDGWYEVDYQFQEEEAFPDLEPISLDKIEMKNGRWTSQEHQRFLEALKLYGKDWDQIQKHIATRDLQNIRAHGQKFLIKLLKFIEGEKEIKEMSLDEAEFYFGVLNQKLHKSMKWEKKTVYVPLKKRMPQLQFPRAKQKIFRVYKAKKKNGPTLSETADAPDLQEDTDIQEATQDVEMGDEEFPVPEPPKKFKEPLRVLTSQFDRWKGNVSNRSNHMSIPSLGHSVKTKQEIVPSNGGKQSVKFSFKSMFDYTRGADDAEIFSEGSAGSDHQLKFDIDNFCAHSLNQEIEFMRKHQLNEALKELSDMDSDDEAPGLILHIEEEGFEFDLLQNVSEMTFAKIFHRIHMETMSHRQPKMYQFIMQKLSRVFDETKTWSQKKNVHCLSFGCNNRSMAHDERTLSAFTEAFYKKSAGSSTDSLSPFSLTYKKGTRASSPGRQAPPEPTVQSTQSALSSEPKCSKSTSPPKEEEKPNEFQVFCEVSGKDSQEVMLETTPAIYMSQFLNRGCACKSCLKAKAKAVKKGCTSSCCTKDAPVDQKQVDNPAKILEDEMRTTEPSEAREEHPLSVIQVPSESQHKSMCQNSCDC